MSRCKNDTACHNPCLAGCDDPKLEARDSHRGDNTLKGLTAEVEGLIRSEKNTQEDIEGETLGEVERLADREAAYIRAIESNAVYNQSVGRMNAYRSILVLLTHMAENKGSALEEAYQAALSRHGSGNFKILLLAVGSSLALASIKDTVADHERDNAVEILLELETT